MTQQLDLFPTAAHLRRVDPTLNMRRFYRLGLQPDLFGGCTLVREWGRIGSGGRVRHDPYASEGQAVTALVTLSQMKTRRGYVASTAIESTNFPEPRDELLSWHSQKQPVNIDAAS